VQETHTKRHHLATLRCGQALLKWSYRDTCCSAKREKRPEETHHP